MIKTLFLSACLLVAGVLPSFGESKVYDLDYEVFEVDGLYYLVSDTVPVYFVGDYVPNLRNVNKFKDYPFFEHVEYNNSLETLFTDGKAWLIPPYYANQIAGLGGDKSYHGELVVPGEVTHDGKTYKVGLAKNFMAESRTDTEHLYSVVISDGVECTLNALGFLYPSALSNRPSYLKTITLGENCKYSNFSLSVDLFYFKNLESVYVSESNTQLFDIDGVLCSRPTEDKAGIVLFIPTCGKKVVEVPEREDLRILGNNAIYSYYNTHLDRINIPATIDSLDYRAIDADVDSVYIYATMPPKTHSTIYVSDDAKLFVPHGCVEAYANDEIWGSTFKEIIDMEASTPATAEKQYIYAEPLTIEAGGEGEIAVRMDLDTDESVSIVRFNLGLPEGVEFLTPDKPKKSIKISEEFYDLPYDEEEGYESWYLQTASRPDGTTSFLFLTRMAESILEPREPVKSTHCVMFRIAVRNTSDKAITFAAEVTHVDIGNSFDNLLIKDGVDVRPDYGNTLYIEDTHALVGSEVTLSVKMRNSVDMEGFAFDLVVPTGLEIVKDAEGRPMVSLSEERTTAARTNSFSAVMITNYMNDAVRVVAASTNGSAISAGDGEVCTVRVRVPNGIGAGSAKITMENIALADTEARSHNMKEMTATLYIDAFDRGDANGDSNVTVADLTAIAHYVMGNAPATFTFTAADANEDGKVDVADFTAVAHLLLYGNINRPAGARMATAQTATDLTQLDNTVYIEPVEAGAGEELTLSVKMKNTVEAEGFQFSLALPKGISVVCDADGLPEVSLSTDRTTASRTNTFQSALQPDGSLRVMAASTNASTFSGTDGEVCTVRLKLAEDMPEGDYALLLNDVAISDTQAQSHNVEQIETTLTVSDASGIEGVLSPGSAKAQKTYDLQGRPAQSGKGILLRNGRKFIGK